MFPGHLRVDALVGDDLRMVLGHGDEQQHPGAPRGGVQVLHEELLDGAAARMQALDAAGHQGRADSGRHQRGRDQREHGELDEVDRNEAESG